jgi:hypothetical protein
MARLKPNESLKSPDKQQNEEQNKQNKTDNTQSVTPRTTKTSKKTKVTEGTNTRTEKRDIPRRKYERNSENIQYYESEIIHRRINRKDRHNQQFDKDGDVVNSSDDDFQQPSDEYAQGNVLTAEEQTFIMINDSHRAPNKEDAKPAARPENQESPPLPEPNRGRLCKQEHETDHMKKLFATFPENTQKQLKEREEKHAMEITAMRRANMDTQNMLTTKTTPAQTMSDHRTTAHFTAMTKPSETLFNRTPEKWPAFEHHLLTEAENPTIRWNQEITNYQPTYGTSEPFNFLEIYFHLHENMTGTLVDDLADAKIVDPISPASQLYKLH